jgi:subtilisin family serine protease
MQALRMTFVALIIAAGTSTVRGWQSDRCACPSAEPPIARRAQELPADTRVGPAVYAELDSSPDGRAYVLVVLRPVGRLDATRLTDHQAAVRERQDDVLARLEAGQFTPVHRYDNFAVMTGYLDAQGLAQLAADPDVRAIETDTRGRALLAESVPFINADIVQDSYCYTGAGITVAVLDTGIDPNHPDLADNAAPGAWHSLSQCSNQGPGALDLNGHGTNVAGIITSAGAIAPPGVAPDADVLAVQVLDPNGFGWVSDWIAGVDHVVSVQGDYGRLAVINMSLGTFDLYEECPCDDYQQALQAALQAAKDAGIVTFASSGNDGSVVSMSAPACLSAATAVAAVYDQYYGREPDSGTYACGCFDPNAHPDLIACFSNRSPCNELAAPGRHITAPGIAWPGTSMYTGTSQAAPHCSGVAALMLEADPTEQLIPCAIVDIQKWTGHPTDDPNQTSPNPRRVDAQVSVDLVVKIPFEQAELLASDGAAGDWFGYSVAIDGEIAVAGARLDNNHNGEAAGAAYVFRYDPNDPTGPWVEEAKLTASDGLPYDEFGWSVAVSGDTVLVGAPQHEHNGIKCGSAYVFRYDPNDPDGPWPEEAELVPLDGAEGDEFGTAVAITGDYALVGAPYDDDQGSSSGSVYYYHRFGSNWVFTQKLLPTDSDSQYTDDRFGVSVALSQMMGAPRAVIGADADDETADNAGAAYDFAYNLLYDSWSQYQKLLAGDGEQGDCFGYSVDRVGGLIAVGAPYDDDMGQNAGSAYVFAWVLYEYVERAKLLACDGAPWDYFGYSVAVGWSPEPPYPADRVVIGAPMDDDYDDNSGSAYLFQWGDNDTPDDPDDDPWYLRAKLHASDGGPGDHFGHAVAASGETALIGAHDHGCIGPSAGAAYVFAPGFEDCNENGYPDDCDIAGGASPDVNSNGVPDECECWGDLDGDGDVDLGDLAQLLANYGTTSGATYEQGDLDGDGDVDLSDLAYLLSVYGTTCG